MRLAAANIELYTLLKSRDALISDLLAENEVLNEQTTALAEAAANLAGQLAAVPQASTEPFRVSEEEQEAQWQLEQGIIDRQEFEHLLKELDFQNANIELDPDYSPREVTY